MLSFIICLVLLIGGYFVYGNFVNNIFSRTIRETPAVRINDGVDYVVMPQWKLFLIQLLNIAGLGTDFRCPARSALGSGSIFMDYVWYNLCRRCARFLLRHDV